MDKNYAMTGTDINIAMPRVSDQHGSFQSSNTADIYGNRNIVFETNPTQSFENGIIT